MAKRQSPIHSERPVQSIAGKRQAILKLNRRIDELKSFDPKSVSCRFSDPQVTAIQAGITETLSAVFGYGTVEYNRYVSAARLDNGPIVAKSSWVFPNEERDDRQLNEAHRYLSEGKARSIALLDRAVRTLEEEIEFSVELLSGDGKEIIESKPNLSKRIFIVHGHNKAPRHEIEILLRSQGLEPIILEQQAGGSITIIEKFEDYSDVGYAVVLLTADDQGKSISEEDLKFRARQNVYLELGFFIGKLERKNVCALRESNVDIPTDLSGIQIEEIDSRGAWKTYLLKALRTAGYSIDLNHL